MTSRETVTLGEKIAVGKMTVGKVATGEKDVAPMELFMTSHAKGRNGSLNGSSSDNGSSGPGFDSCCHWELGFFSLFSFLSFNQSLMEVQHYWISTFQENEKLSSAA